MDTDEELPRNVPPASRRVRVFMQTFCCLSYRSADPAERREAHFSSVFICVHPWSKFLLLLFHTTIASPLARPDNLRMGLRVLIVPDKFKGTLTAQQAA